MNSFSCRPPSHHSTHKFYSQIKSIAIHVITPSSVCANVFYFLGPRCDGGADSRTPHVHRSGQAQLLADVQQRRKREADRLLPGAHHLEGRPTETAVGTDLPPRRWLRPGRGVEGERHERAHRPQLEGPHRAPENSRHDNRQPDRVHPHRILEQRGRRQRAVAGARGNVHRGQVASPVPHDAGGIGVLARLLLAGGHPAQRHSGRPLQHLHEGDDQGGSRGVAHLHGGAAAGVSFPRAVDLRSR